MATFADLKRLEQDPRFAQLPYAIQLEIRSKVGASILYSSPEFAQVPLPQREEALTKLAFQPPRFESPRYAEQVAQITQAAAKGDVQAKQFMANTLIAAEFHAKSLIFGTINQKLMIPLAKSLYPGEATKIAIRMQEMSPDAKKAAEYFDYQISKDKQWAKRNQIARTLIGIGGMVAHIGLLEGVLA